MYVRLDNRAAGNRTRSLRTRSACTTGILRPDRKEYMINFDLHNFCVYFINLLPKLKLKTSWVSRENRTLMAAFTGRNFTIKLWTPSLYFSKVILEQFFWHVHNQDQLVSLSLYKTTLYFLVLLKFLIFLNDMFYFFYFL